MFYELTLVLPTDREKQALDKVKKLIDTAGGEINKTDEWGKRELVYPIKKQKEAVYYALAISLEADKTASVIRILENDDDVLRHLMLKSSAGRASSTSSTGKKAEKKEVVKKVKKEVKSKVKAGKSKK